MPGDKPKISDLGSNQPERFEMGVHQLISIKPLVDPDSPPPMKLEEQTRSSKNKSGESNKGSEISEKEGYDMKGIEKPLSIIQMAQKKMKEAIKKQKFEEE